jgi:hypothetical protein
MSERRIAVFFYGLFMDADLLRQKNAHPTNIRRGRVDGFSLRIAKRATLVPEPRGRIHGVVMSLSHDEIDRLYAEESLRAYRPEPVWCEIEDGSREPALCFNLAEAPSPGERNAEYAQKLRELARRLDLPASYVDGIA